MPGKKQPHRVVLCDDDRWVRQGLRSLLNECPDFDVAAEFENAPDLLEFLALATEQLDLVIIDLEFSGRIVLPVLETLVADGRRVVVFSAHDEFAHEVVEHGVAGYVSKLAGDAALLAAARCACRGYFSLFLPQAMRPRLNPPQKPEAVDEQELGLDFSSRELAVLTLMAGGAINREIAQSLCISPKTVESYRTRLSKKTGLSRRTELVRYAIQHGLVAP